MRTNRTFNKARMSNDFIMADRTFLTSVSRININNSNSLSNSFIFNKALELPKSPLMNPFIISSSLSNVSYVLHYNNSSIHTIYNFLTNVMISPSHELSPSSTQSLKFSFGRFSAFSLEFANQFIMLNPQSFNSTSIKFPITSYSKMIYSDINAKNSLIVRAFGIDIFGECKHKETSIPFIYSQQTFINIPSEIFLITIWNDEWNFNPSFNCANAQDIILEGSRTWKVVSDRTFVNNGLGFSSFNNPTSLFDTSNGKLGWESNAFKMFIDERMEFNIILDSIFPSNINAVLQSPLIEFNSPNNLRICIDSDFSSCSNYHNNTIFQEYINLSEGVFPPKTKVMGIQNTNTL